MDIRVRITKQLIREAFFDLLKEKPASGITVKELCEKADINRTTFYKYYADIPELLRSIENSVLDELQALILQQNDAELSTVFTVILNDIAVRRDLYLPLFGQSDGRIFRERIFALLYENSKKQILHFFPDAPANRQEWLYYFIANGCTSVLDWWIAEGMQQDPQEIVLFLTGLISTINHHAQIDFGRNRQ